ncbi:hypothetical protein Tco_0589161 [Tanacetum coccineum]
MNPSNEPIKSKGRLHRLADLKEFKKVNEICAKNHVFHISLLHRLLRAQHTSISSEMVPVDKFSTSDESDLYSETSCWTSRWPGTATNSLTLAPGVSPSPRYQHAAVFVGARLHVTEGVLKGGREVDGEGAAVLDTPVGVWLDIHGMVTSRSNSKAKSTILHWSSCVVVDMLLYTMVAKFKLRSIFLLEAETQ